MTDGIDVLLTNADSGIEGAVFNDTGAPVPDFVIVVVPADRNGWRFPSRRIRTARPDQDGRFRVNGLPSGDYLAMALSEGDESIAQDFEALDRLRSSATSVVVASGALKPVRLKLVTTASSSHR